MGVNDVTKQVPILWLCKSDTTIRFLILQNVSLSIIMYQNNHFFGLYNVLLTLVHLSKKYSRDHWHLPIILMEEGVSKNLKIKKIRFWCPWGYFMIWRYRYSMNSPTYYTYSLKKCVQSIFFYLLFQVINSFEQHLRQ